MSTKPTMADFERRRMAMVETQIARRGIRDEHLLSAMRTVPRHEFMPDELRLRAYHDEPLPIGHGQTTADTTDSSGTTHQVFTWDGADPDQAPDDSTPR